VLRLPIKRQMSQKAGKIGSQKAGKIGRNGTVSQHRV
jgi:hypothetical protein